jgi:hypothetical protein
MPVARNMIRTCLAAGVGIGTSPTIGVAPDSLTVTAHIAASSVDCCLCGERDSGGPRSNQGNA